MRRWISRRAGARARPGRARRRHRCRATLGLRLAQPRVERVGHAGQAQLAQRAVEFDRIHGSPWFVLEQLLVVGELADQWIDLAQRQRGPGGARVAADKAVDGAPVSSANAQAASSRACPCFFASDACPGCDGCRARAVGAISSHTVSTARPRTRARCGVCATPGGVLRGRSSSMRKRPGRWRMCSRSTPTCAGGGCARAVCPTAPAAGDRSTRAACRKTHGPLRRSRPDARCACRTRSTRRLDRQWQQRWFFLGEHRCTCRLVVPWMRVSAQCASQRSRYAWAAAASRSAGRASCPGVALTPTRPCPCGLDRAPAPAALSRRSA